MTEETEPDQEILPRPAPGDAVVVPLKGKWKGWYSCHVGRKSYVKRFNLSAIEAGNLVRELIAAGSLNPPKARDKKRTPAGGPGSS